MSFLPAAAAACLAASLIVGWIIALIRYGKIESIRNLFPGHRFLVKVHIDYAIMAVLVFVVYLVLTSLGLSLSKPATAALIIGALYNPFGFVLQAVKPGIAESDSIPLKAGILLGFIPATYGFGSACFLIIASTLSGG